MDIFHFRVSVCFNLNTRPDIINQNKTVMLIGMSRLIVNKNSDMIHSGNFTI